ncbi:TetR/AcrR family transcriptional regulator [Citreicella sp. C3M06]|uniref:TetR/AcrR family transcriptional regulator n=1 Tax=Citreicella sp. C3M06 TaxID=2841564 RepID=UPI001C082A69|nr:TetR/AcrR family transcriptional regulator [Citreicella sp. C3M06]MBU2963642.1 TetR/AcrR family transcriptional regulator [Citreicella sp. C3M06]
MTRKQAAQRTRDRLIEAAETLFGARGYNATSLDAIAAEAGYTKGAVYANFPGKEALFLAVLETHGGSDLLQLVDAIAAAPGRDEIEELLIDWAGARAESGSWPLTLIEFVRQKRDDAETIAQLTEILHRNWRTLGEAVVGPLNLTESPLLIGAALFETAYAPAMSIVSNPSARDLMRLFLRSHRS